MVLSVVEKSARPIGGAAVAIEIRRMTKWYGAFHALRDIDLTIKQGERIVIAGPLGSGKSTLIRCINRLETHDSGQIVVDVTALTTDLQNIDRVRSKVGMVFLFPHLTVLENCTLAPIWVRHVPKNAAEQQALHFLEKVKIPDPTSIRGSCRAGNNNAWQLRGRFACGPGSCSSTSRHQPLIRR